MRADIYYDDITHTPKVASEIAFEKVFQKLLFIQFMKMPRSTTCG